MDNLPAGRKSRKPVEISSRIAILGNTQNSTACGPEGRDLMSKLDLTLRLARVGPDDLK